LTADVHFGFIAPCDLQLVKVSANCDVNTSFILDIGTEGDVDAYLDAKTITGATATNTEKGKADFVGTEYPHIVDGTEVRVSIDYDGGAGTDAAGVSILLTFTEG
jgi:hypothetical protein